MIRSNSNSSAMYRPSTPSSATSTTKPASTSPFFRNLAVLASSSMTRILILSSPRVLPCQKVEIRRIGSSDSADLKCESRRKLQGPWQPVGMNFLQCSKVPRPRIRNQIAGLIQSHAVTTGCANRIVLQSIDAPAVLHIVISMVEKVESLHL